MLGGVRALPGERVGASYLSVLQVNVLEDVEGKVRVVVLFC